ncbi:DUF975 family protein [Terrisporobacter sp.]
MWTRSQLKYRGKTSFKKFYWKSVLVCFICLILNAGIGSGVSNRMNNYFNSGSNTNYNYNYYSDDDYYNEDLNSEVNGFTDVISSFFIVKHLMIFAMIGVVALVIGFAIKLLIVYPIEVGKNNFFMGIREGERTLGSLIFAYKSGYLKNIIITIFMKGLFQWLWSLLLIIPGIIKSYEYRMIPYILSENPQISRKRAFEISKQMMMGNKWNTFILDLSFIGWEILSAITVGILGIFYVNPYVQGTNAELYAYLREDALQQGYVTSSELIGF